MSLWAFGYRQRTSANVGIPPPSSSVEAAVAPTDIGWQALGPAIAFTAAALIVVIARGYTRIVITRLIGWEDWLIAVALFLSIAMTAVVGAQNLQDMQINMDRNTWGKVGQLQPTTAKLVLASNTIYQALINITKASFIVQYLRIFADRTVQRICWLLLFILLFAACWGIFGGIFLCRPVAKLFEHAIPGHCMDAETYWFSASAIGVAMDFIIWFLPMPLVGKLRLPKKQMIGLVIVFALGGFVCVVSVLRLAIVHVLALKRDFPRSGVAAITWSTIEANVGIICASLMAIKPLVVRLFPNLMVDKQLRPLDMTLPTMTEMNDNWVWSRSQVEMTCASKPPSERLDTWTGTGIKVDCKVTQEVEERVTPVTPVAPSTPGGSVVEKDLMFNFSEC